jgi:hypothetical protein
MSNQRLRYTCIHDDVMTADTPQKMRAAIEKSGYSHLLVRRALDMARIEGLNGEDTMVLLATHLLRENDRMHEDLLRHINTSLSPMYIVSCQKCGSK